MNTDRRGFLRFLPLAALGMAAKPFEELPTISGDQKGQLHIHSDQPVTIQGCRFVNDGVGPSVHVEQGVRGSRL